MYSMSPPFALSSSKGEWRGFSAESKNYAPLFVIEAIKLFNHTSFSTGVFPFRLSDEGNQLRGAV